MTPEELQGLQSRLAPLHYDAKVRSKLFVIGQQGTDREGETFWYNLDEMEPADLIERVIWERSWDGYEPVEDYIARNPMPVPHG